MILGEDVKEVVEKLFKKHMQGEIEGDECSVNESKMQKNTPDLDDGQEMSLVSEFLFLIKWQGMTYYHSTWEPLSAIS